MRTLIIGNSNSILSDGWTRPLRQMRPNDTWVNISLGGSPSPALLYQIISRKDVHGKFELVILEPTVVDHGEGWMNPDQIAGQAQALLQVLKASGAQVLLLVLPRNAEYALSPSRGMLAWAAMAHRMSIPLLDARQAVIKHAQGTGQTLEQMWRDNAGHLTVEAQRAVAVEVDAWMTQAAHASFDLQLPQDLAWRVITGAELAQVNGLPSVPRATSLMQVTCLSLCAGDQFTVPIKPEEIVLGLGLNYGEVDPTEKLSILAHGSPKHPPKAISLQNNFLTAKISGKLVVMFKKVDLPTGVCVFSFPDTPEHARLSRESVQRLEIVGLLVGKPIVHEQGWMQDGQFALGIPSSS